MKSRCFEAERPRHAATADTIIVADGFSCREQFRHGTGRTPLHLAEAIALAV